MKTTRLLLLISLSALLAACNLPRPQPTLVDDWVGTAAAQTVAAIQTQLIPAETVTPVAATSTNAPPVSTAALITTVPCDRAEFVSDETIPDYTTLAPGEVFIKTWRLKNIGTCTWTNAYRVVFESGNALGAPASFTMPKVVPPGEMVDISVEMRAPELENDYESYWKLQNPTGVNFGLGSDGEKAFWVKITVSEEPAFFAVTRVVISADAASYTGSCPHTFNFTAAITATTEGKVTYYWERSDGSRSTTFSLEFSEGGTKNVTYAWEWNRSLDGWVKIYIDAPNHQYFDPFTVKLTCN